MFTSKRILAALCLVAFAAACAPKPQEVVPVQEPITTEPTSSGKYN